MLRTLSLLIVASIGFGFAAKAQDFDVSNYKADPMTFVFDDGKHTVNGYIYSVLEDQTTCCGNDGIYLEVVFNSDGLVTSAKTLTGKSDCYKKAVVDIVKNVSWNASGVKSSKTIYFEVKPIIPCSGGANENVYAGIKMINPLASGNQSEEVEVSEAPDPIEEEEVEEVVAEEEEVHEEVVAMEEEYEEEEVAMEEEVEEEVMEEEVVEESVEEVDESVTTVADNTYDDAEEVVEEVVEEVATIGTGDDSKKAPKDDGFLTEEKKGNTKSWDNMYDGDHQDTKPAPTASKINNAKIPPQDKIPYTSNGDRDPQESHRDSHWNGQGPSIVVPDFKEGESQVAVHLKSQLRKQGVCGLAQAAIDLTLDPNGNVVDQVILASNSEKVSSLLPGILKQMRFRPQPGARFNYHTYIHFKTDITCAGQKPINLDMVQDYLTNPLAPGNN